MYGLVKPALFKTDPERAHGLTLASLEAAHRLGALARLYPAASKPVSCMGLQFGNPVGLAAGLDKNGDHIDALGSLGFGFIEIGTVTPRPQDGNPKPRLFRLPDAQAVINRMGFNNNGVDALVRNVERASYRGVLGINIGKNATTPVEDAVEDYVTGLERVYPYASYITVNISSPNTQGLRGLQSGDALLGLLDTLKNRQSHLATQHGRYVPLVLKVAPDLDANEIGAIAEALTQFNIDGLIATNTTLARTGVEHLPYGNEAGGLSGLPVFERSTEVLAEFVQALGGRVPVIGVGGIVSGAHAQAKQAAGATLCQLYSGLVYRGPALVAESVRAWNA